VAHLDQAWLLWADYLHKIYFLNNSEKRKTTFMTEMGLATLAKQTENTSINQQMPSVKSDW
jgi:hypothetical protein